MYRFLENLEAITRAKHCRLHFKTGREFWDLVCLNCNIEFKREAKYERSNRKQGKQGPYCGKKCAGTVK